MSFHISTMDTCGVNLEASLVVPSLGSNYALNYAMFLPPQGPWDRLDNLKKVLIGVCKFFEVS
jgi:hypothetical protein